MDSLILLLRVNILPRATRRPKANTLLLRASILPRATHRPASTVLLRQHPMEDTLPPLRDTVSRRRLRGSTVTPLLLLHHTASHRPGLVATALPRRVSTVRLPEPLLNTMAARRYNQRPQQRATVRPRSSNGMVARTLQPPVKP